MSEMNSRDRELLAERLLRTATHVIGSRAAARAWLNEPQYGLGGAVALDYARTKSGAREVEDLLGRIEFGIYSWCFKGLTRL